MSLARAALALSLVWIAVQLAVPAALFDRRAVTPFASRFSWSMFAARPIARCTHALTWRGPDGASAPMPMPPHGHPARAVLDARTEDEFMRAIPLLTAYARDDDEVVAALHALLRRHRDRVDPAHRHTLTSTLRCVAWGGRPFTRALRLEAR